MTDQEKSALAANTLQEIVNEERRKRVEAENFAKALQEEFASCNEFDDVRKLFREKIKEFAPQALINIVSMANGAESESVRASLNKWVLEWAMSDKIDGSNDEISNLLKALKKDPSITTT